VKYVVYEVWTRARVVEAPSIQDAYTNNVPQPSENMTLCNWHVVSVATEGTVHPDVTGGLNYRQV